MSWKVAFAAVSAVCLSVASPGSARADGVGFLTVTCAGPDGQPLPADVSIDGADAGMTPITHFRLTAESHKLVFVVAGKRPRKMNIVIADGEEKTLNVNM